MTRWVRAAMTRRCGGCGRTVQVGETVVELRLDGIDATRDRCVACAVALGKTPEDPEPDLPPAVERERSFTSMRSIGVQFELPKVRDSRQRAANDEDR